VTLPRAYVSVDVCGFYSDDGKVLNIPAERYIYKNKDADIEYVLFTYETEHYTLTGKTAIENKNAFEWPWTKDFFA